MNDGRVINWLLKGDPSIRWQVMRDLTGAKKSEYLAERKKIAKEGWGKRLLSYQKPDGGWDGIYTYKWTSTTYTMLLLRRMGLEPSNLQAQKGCRVLMEKGFYRDGGINFFKSLDHAETCVTGMVLSILSHFRYGDKRIHALSEYLLDQQMMDGGWNCESYNGATHSSLHTTLSVLEGLREYEKNFNPKTKNIRIAQQHAMEFLLAHKLYRSHRTGAIIDRKMTMFSFPPRWVYDVMKALDYLRDFDARYSSQYEDAMGLLQKKRNRNGTWNTQNRHTGKTYFEMEKAGKPGRWNTLRALRILRWWDRARTVSRPAG